MLGVSGHLHITCVSGVAWEHFTYLIIWPSADQEISWIITVQPRPGQGTLTPVISKTFPFNIHVPPPGPGAEMFINKQYRNICWDIQFSKKRGERGLIEFLASCDSVGFSHFPEWWGVRLGIIAFFENSEMMNTEFGIQKSCRDTQWE